MTEWVGEGWGSGCIQLLHGLLREAAAAGSPAAFVDGKDSLDVDALEDWVLERMLWVRCTGADQAMKAVDLLLRDGNLALVLLDLKMNPARELRRIPASAWHRMHRLMEARGTTLVVLTPFAMVGRADCRWRIQSRMGLDGAMSGPAQVAAQVVVEGGRRGVGAALPAEGAGTGRRGLP